MHSFEKLLQSTFFEYLPDSKFYQEKAAYEYSIMLACDHTMFDWARINQAIIDKWSVSGLKRVKEMAWKIYGG